MHCGRSPQCARMRIVVAVHAGKRGGSSHAILATARPSCFDLSRVIAMATNFGQNWQNDLHSASWHFKKDLI